MNFPSSTWTHRLNFSTWTPRGDDLFSSTWTPRGTIFYLTHGQPKDFPHNTPQTFLHAFPDTPNFGTCADYIMNEGRGRRTRAEPFRIIVVLEGQGTLNAPESRG